MRVMNINIKNADIMTKKQTAALKTAINLIELEAIKTYPENTRVFENLFENGYNNNNSLLVELMDIVENNPSFARKVLKYRDIMPRKLVIYAEAFADMPSEKDEAIEKLINKADEIQRNITLFREDFTKEDFENLYRYYIQPLENVM